MSRLTDSRWAARLKRLEAELKKMKALDDGTAVLKTVHVKQSVWIERHRRAAHVRVIVVPTKKGK